jgi:hypothetical protein
MLKKCKTFILWSIEPDKGLFRHLHILLDDEIKDGDYILDLANSKIFKWYKDEYSNSTDYKKIIATTDPELHKDGIAKIPQGFIDKFFNSLNEGNVIDEIKVEYQKYWDVENDNFSYKSLSGQHDGEILKLGIDKTIIIHRIKNNWTREEIKEIALKWEKYSFGKSNRGLDPDWNPEKEFDEWIEENL